MHSFHHSRGRILFEVLCALAVSVSCVQAWMQTGASALLGAAAAAALYGIVHLFDLRRPGDAALVAAVVSEPAVTRPVIEELTPAEPAAAEPKPKAPRKAAAKKPRAKPKAAVPPPEPQPEPEADTSLTEVEHDPVPLAPLFQPEPFLRQQQRGMFGRKAGFRP